MLVEASDSRWLQKKTNLRYCQVPELSSIEKFEILPISDRVRFSNRGHFNIPLPHQIPQYSALKGRMGEIRKSPKKKATPNPELLAEPSKPLGRKRDHGRDQDFLEATLDILAEIGFDSMTMDQVAARAKAGKATLYRRWSSKELLVRDALIGMSRNSIEVDHLPDTGSLRDDLLAVVKPYSMEYSERKLKILAGLGSFSTQHQTLYDEALAGIFGPWTKVNTTLMERAVRRKELPPNADISGACEIIVSMTAFRTTARRKQFDRASYQELLDHFLIPGLKNKRP